MLLTFQVLPAACLLGSYSYNSFHNSPLRLPTASFWPWACCFYFRFHHLVPLPLDFIPGGVIDRWASFRALPHLGMNSWGRSPSKWKATGSIRMTRLEPSRFQSHPPSSSRRKWELEKDNEKIMSPCLRCVCGGGTSSTKVFHQLSTSAHSDRFRSNKFLFHFPMCYNSRLPARLIAESFFLLVK